MTDDAPKKRPRARGGRPPRQIDMQGVDLTLAEGRQEARRRVFLAGCAGFPAAATGALVRALADLEPKDAPPPAPAEAPRVMPRILPPYTPPVPPPGPKPYLPKPFDPLTSSPFEEI